MSDQDVHVGHKIAGQAADGKTKLRQVSTPWIVMLGVDGAGKSSVLDILIKESFSGIRGVKVFHRRPAVVYARSVENSSIISHYGKPPHGQIKSVIKLFVMVLDWIMGYWLEIRKWCSQGYLVISDRHSLMDMLVDPLRYRYGGPRRLVNLVLPLTPQPDLILLLDAPEEVLEARKTELTTQMIKELREGYLQLSHSLPNFRVIDASQSIEEVCADVVEAIQTLRLPKRLPNQK
jgi:thymidylate kinase